MSKYVKELLQAELEKKLSEGQFTLEDFRDQLKSVAQPGLMQKMLGLLPGMGELPEHVKNQVNDREIHRTIAIINSITRWSRGIIEYEYIESSNYN